MFPNRWSIALFVALGLLAGPFAWGQGQDRIKLKSDPAKPVVGNIQKETPAGIRVSLKGGSRTFPAGDVLDVTYDVKGVIKIDSYLPAMNSEAKIEAPVTKDRKKAIMKAINDYEDVARKAGAKKSQEKCDLLERHAYFKVAMLEARLAQESGAAPTTAIKRLREFKMNHGDGWQITAAATMLAQLLVEAEKFDEAEKVYLDLAGLADLTPEARGQFQLLAAQVSVRPGKYAEAQAKLQAIIDKLPTDSPHRVRAQISQAVCQAEMKLEGLKKDADQKDRAAAIAEAKAKINALLDEHKADKELRALAYNALGDCNYAAKQYKDALWSYLRVDVVYHQNKEEHAKALYYLAILFDHLKDKEHADECRSRLASKLFAGTDYQRRPPLKENGEKDK